MANETTTKSRIVETCETLEGIRFLKLTALEMIHVLSALSEVSENVKSEIRTALNRALNSHGVSVDKRSTSIGFYSVDGDVLISAVFRTTEKSQEIRDAIAGLFPKSKTTLDTLESDGMTSATIKL